jgi:hypothetical protein
MTTSITDDMHYVMSEDAQSRLERAHAALEFVADLLGTVEVLTGLNGKATGIAPAAQRRHANVHAGGMAHLCHLVTDELAAVLQSAQFAGAEEQADA